MLAEDIGLLIKRVQHRHHRGLDSALAPLGVTFIQWNALREIARNPRTPQRHLAELTFNSDQAFGTLCTRLENAGWITRAPGPSRALFLSLTASGEKLRRAGQRSFTKVIERSFVALNSKEQAYLHALLTKLSTTHDDVKH